MNMFKYRDPYKRDEWRNEAQHMVGKCKFALYTLTPDEPPTVSAHTETRPDSMKFSHILGLADTVEAIP